MLLYAAWGFALSVTHFQWGSKRVRLIHVLDGDTYIAQDESGRKHRIRLFGCDCPEVGQPLADEATRFVRENTRGQWMTAKFRGKDRYRRQLASIKLPNGDDLTVALVRQGLAYPLRGGLGLTTLGARLSRKGVWGQWRRKKPWEARTRRPGLLGWLARRSRRRR